MVQDRAIFTFQVNGSDVTSLGHSQIVNLLKVRNAAINIVAVRSASRHKVVWTQSRGTDSALSPAHVKPDPDVSSISDVELTDGAGGEVSNKYAALPSIQQVLHSVERTETRNQSLATCSTSSSLTLSAMQTSRDRRVARKTVSSVNSVTMTTPAAAANQTQLTRTVCSTVSSVATATEPYPVEV